MPLAPPFPIASEAPPFPLADAWSPPMAPRDPLMDRVSGIYDSIRDTQAQRPPDVDAATYNTMLGMGRTGGGFASRAAAGAIEGIQGTVQSATARGLGAVLPDDGYFAGLANEIDKTRSLRSAARQQLAGGLVGRTVTGVAENLPKAFLAAATGAGAPALIGTFVYDASSQAYAETGDKTYAATVGALEGAVTAAFNLVGLGGLEQSLIKGGAWQGVKNLAKQIGAELAEEEIIGLGQAVSAQLEGVNPDALKNAPQKAVDIAAQTLLTMGLVGAGQRVAPFLARPSRSTARAAGVAEIAPSSAKRQSLADGALMTAAEKIWTDKVTTDPSTGPGPDVPELEGPPPPSPTLDPNDEAMLTELQRRMRRKFREAGFKSHEWEQPVQAFADWFRAGGHRKFKPGVETVDVTSNEPAPAPPETAPPVTAPSASAAGLLPKSVLSPGAAVEELKIGAANAVRSFKRNFLSGGLQNAPTRTMTYRRDSVIRGHLAELDQNKNELIRQAKKSFGVPAYRQLPDNITEALDVALKGGPLPANATPEVAVAVQKMRDHVDGLSTQVQALGQTGVELFLTIEKNKGAYITRTFKKFADPEGWRRKAMADPQIFTDMAAEVRQTSPNATDDEIRQLMEILLRRDTMSNADLEATGSRTQNYVNILRERKDLSDAVRALYGENKDAFVNYTETIGQMANLVAHRGFVENLRAEGLAQGFFSDGKQPKPGHVQEVAHGQHKQLEGLKGILMEPDIATSINDLYAMKAIGGWQQTLATLSTVTKAAKTVWSFPKSWIRNFLGNPAIAVANGHWTFKDLANFGTAAKNTFWDDLLKPSSPAGRAAMRRMKELGVVEGVNLEALRDAAKHASVTVQNYVAGIDSRHPVKKLAGAAGRGYQAMDTVWKIQSYLGELETLKQAHPGQRIELLEEQAARQVRSITPTYSEASRAAKLWSRYAPFGPFAMFASEIIRTTGNRARLIASEMNSGNPVLQRQAAKRLIGQGAVLAAGFAVSQLAKQLLGVSDEQEEAMRDRVAPWQRNSQLLVTSTDENGAPKNYFDLGFNDPFGVISKPLEALIRGEPGEAAREFAEPFTSEDLFAGTVASLLRNSDENGRPVWSEGATPSEQNRQIIEYVVKRLEPGVLTTVKRIKAAARGETTKSGQPLDLANELTSTFGGARKEVFDRETADYYRNREFHRKAQASVADIRRLFLGKGTFNAETTRRAYQGAEEARRKTLEDWRKYVDGSIVLGEKNPYAKVVQDVGGESTMVKLMYGKVYRPYQFTAQDLRKMLQMPDGEARLALYRELQESKQ